MGRSWAWSCPISTWGPAKRFMPPPIRPCAAETPPDFAAWNGTQSRGRLFRADGKDYETPLGRVETDRKAVGRLRRPERLSRVHPTFPIGGSTHWSSSSSFSSTFSAPPSAGAHPLRFVWPHFERVSRPAAVPGVAGLLSELRPCGKKTRPGPCLSRGWISPISARNSGIGSGRPPCFVTPRPMIRLSSLRLPRATPGVSGRTRGKTDTMSAGCQPSPSLDFLSGAKGRLLAYDFWMEEATHRRSALPPSCCMRAAK